MQVNRVVDGGEPTIFKQYFASWKEETGGKEHVPVPIKNGRIAGKQKIIPLIDSKIKTNFPI